MSVYLPSRRRRPYLPGGSVSKDYALTVGIGYLRRPKEIMQALVRVHQYTNMCAPTTPNLTLSLPARVR